MNKAKHRRKSAGIATSRGYNSTLPGVKIVKRSVWARLQRLFRPGVLQTALEMVGRRSEQPKTAPQVVDSKGPKTTKNVLVVG